MIEPVSYIFIDKRKPVADQIQQIKEYLDYFANAFNRQQEEVTDNGVQQKEV